MRRNLALISLTVVVLLAACGRPSTSAPERRLVERRPTAGRERKRVTLAMVGEPPPR